MEFEMKKTFFQFVIVILFSPTTLAQSGWVWQNPLPQTNNLWDADFVNSDVGWAVGEGGTIIKTTNGGVSWLNQSHSIAKLLYSVCFVDVNTGWIVGESGTILKSTNGGTSWNIQSTGYSIYLHSVF